MIRRWKTLAASFAGISLIATSMWIDPPPRLLWNASPSVPIGFYWVRSGEHLASGDLAVVAPPQHIARYLDEGGYLPLGVPLLKPVAALPGQIVCRIADMILIEGMIVGRARASDRLGRTLPSWQGCQTLGPDQLFFMNAEREDSLDGRYFGPFPAASVIGIATPL